MLTLVLALALHADSAGAVAPGAAEVPCACRSIPPRASDDEAPPEAARRPLPTSLNHPHRRGHSAAGAPESRHFLADAARAARDGLACARSPGRPPGGTGLRALSQLPLQPLLCVWLI